MDKYAGRAGAGKVSDATPSGARCLPLKLPRIGSPGAATLFPASASFLGDPRQRAWAWVRVGGNGGVGCEDPGSHGRSGFEPRGVTLIFPGAKLLREQERGDGLKPLRRQAGDQRLPLSRWEQPLKLFVSFPRLAGQVFWVSRVTGQGEGCF